MNTAFSNAVRNKKNEGLIPVIPDIKCFSPKEGDLLKGRDPAETAKNLATFGAPAISVVTEEKNFKGSLNLLEQVVKETGLPVLRKDFITQTDDLKRTKDCGAEAVLLMCAVQSHKMLFYLYEEALRIGLEPLVEAHTGDELRLIETLGAKLVGINNRNIIELEKDDGTVSNTADLAYMKPKGAVLISESSIRSPEQAKAAIFAGADGVLVGTSIWQAANMQEFYSALCYGEG